MAFIIKPTRTKVISISKVCSESVLVHENWNRAVSAEFLEMEIKGRGLDLSLTKGQFSLHFSGHIGQVVWGSFFLFSPAGNVEVVDGGDFTLTGPFSHDYWGESFPEESLEEDEEGYLKLELVRARMLEIATERCS